MQPLRIHLNNQPRFYHCEPGWRWSPPPLPDNDLWCVAAGEGQMLLGDRAFPLVSNVCFVLPPDCRPIATQHPQRRLVVFAGHFSCESDTTLPLHQLLQRDLAFFWSLAEQCARCAARGDALGDLQSQLLMEQMLLHLLEAATIPTPPPDEERLQEIILAIRASPGAEWSVDEQARRACLSRSQYTRRFTRATGGVSPTRFVVQARLERAHQLIRETDMTLTQIADALGYRDLFYFSRQFKAHFGIAPSGVRE